MAQLVLRQIKGYPITDAEMDGNFTNLNRDGFLSTRNSTPWVANTSFAKGDILNVSNRFYLVTTGGTSDTTAPTHTTGSVANGTLVLQYTLVAGYTAKDVLEKIKYLDGIGSGLDTDLVRGLGTSSSLPTSPDKSSIVSRDTSGNSSFNIINSNTINSSVIDSTSISVDEIEINDTFRVGGFEGTIGQVLTSAGTGNIPIWTTINTTPVITDDTSSTGSRYITFTNGTGTQTLGADTGLQYNLDANILSTNISGNAATATTVPDNSVSLIKLTSDAQAIGRRSIWIPANQITPRGTNGASIQNDYLASNDTQLYSLAFDSAANEFAQFTIRMPKSWDLGSITVTPLWTANSSSALGVVWSIRVKYATDDLSLNTSWSTSVLSSDVNGAAPFRLRIAPETSPVLLGTAIPEMLVQFEIWRSVTNAGDTLASDALLLGVTVNYNTNAVNDN